MGEKETKLSFSFSKLSSRPNPPKPPPRDSDSDSGAGSSSAAQFVTFFDPSQTLDSAAASQLVIPPIPNTFDPSKRPNHFIPLPTASSSSASAGSDVQYGLTVRSTSNGSRSGPQRDEEERRDPDDLMLRMLKEDMRNLPDDRGLEEFKDVPLEGFARAILAGYGWSEGKGIGRNNSKGDTKVVEYNHRGGTQGLGYKPSLSDPQKQRGEWKVMDIQRSLESSSFNTCL